MPLSMKRKDKIRNLVSSIDLKPMKFKLMECEEGLGWSLEKANQIEVLYRRFLFLNAIHPDVSIVPTKEIDHFWHAHILDTRKYAEDCNTIFGHFFHHFPYFGLRGDKDKQNMEASFLSSQALYHLEFPGAAIEYQTQSPFSAIQSERQNEAAVCGGGGSCGGSPCSRIGGQANIDKYIESDRPGVELSTSLSWH